MNRSRSPPCANVRFMVFKEGKIMINKVKQIKKNVQRSIIAFMAMILVVGSFDLTVIHAVNNRVTTGDRINYSTNATNAEGRTFWSEYTDHIYVDGEVAFCVEPGQWVESNAYYSESRYTATQRANIEKIAYIGCELSNKTEEDSLVTVYMFCELM